MKVKPKLYLALILKDLFADKLHTEFLGIPGRKFRFDWAIPEYKLAIEYEGIISAKSRHTSITGFTADTTKYNLAQLNGWIVLRFTQLNFFQAKEQVQQFLRMRSEHTLLSSVGQ